MSPGTRFPPPKLRNVNSERVTKKYRIRGLGARQAIAAMLVLFAESLAVVQPLPAVKMSTTSEDAKFITVSTVPPANKALEILPQEAAAGISLGRDKVAVNHTDCPSS